MPVLTLALPFLIYGGFTYVIPCPNHEKPWAPMSDGSSVHVMMVQRQLLPP